MCGITGSVWRDPSKRISRETLSQMASVLQHRGPDDAQEFFTSSDVAGVAFGFRRLAIIDLNTGQQPVTNDDKSVVVMLNGEIYNYLELRQLLESKGYRFKTAGDSEVIVHMYSEYGTECFSKLNGMFAIAIWDERTKQLILARDRLGQKPLYFWAENHRLSFASELKSLFEIPDCPREINQHALHEYLVYQYVPYPHCIVDGLSKLSPGHFLVFDESGISTTAYWELPTTESTVSKQDLHEQLWSMLEESVKLRMQSDVPLGAFLSGGVDSSLIVALMQRNSSERIKTYSIGFPIKEYDETSHAREVAKHLNTDHHEFQVTPSATEILPKLVWHYDEPLADSSAIPTWYVSQMTRQEVTVALSGDGGDELFAGYPRYQAVELARKIERWPGLKWLLGSRCWNLLPSSSRYKSRLRRLKKFFHALRKPAIQRYLSWISIFPDEEHDLFYTSDFKSAIETDDVSYSFNQHYSRFSHRDPITAISLADLHTYLPGDLMSKVDIASMGNSLEVRQPFLDYRVAELAAQIPISLKFSKGRGKQILRDVFGDLLPDSIWDRPKMGFGVPMDHWLKMDLNELLHDTLLKGTPAVCRYIEQEAIERMVSNHERGRQDNSQRLWSLLVLQNWMDRWNIN